MIGFALMALNIYGLTQSLRMPELGVKELEKLRFVPNEVWDSKTSLKAISNLKSVTKPTKLANRATLLVNKSLVHVDWPEVDPVAYRQLVPPWENIFLWGVGEFSGLPQFERYHYTDYRRTIERGIGICGDAATVLSSVLGRFGIPNNIISFDGHVIVEYQARNNEWLLLDPDFGVVLGHSLAVVREKPEVVRQAYLSAGYSAGEVEDLIKIYSGRYKKFDDTYGFMAKRYIFERLTYVLKWILPILLMFPILVLWFYRKKVNGFFGQ
ncbi:transglutaminase-like domain-containing protein [Marinobacter santoriniensis]|uniref:transglutaminase-like domain-containing protein n=1 Tax=Marinobacter santoriniensis TaxID=523742 RepID=UPI00126A1ACA|nr:transglutaminase-like domain-containing protein [Marinobacter santoriniensis]